MASNGMRERPQALIFDVFGTLVDWREGVATCCRQAFAEKSIDRDPYHFADRWRGEYQPAMQPIREGERDYVALDQLHLENLARTLDETGLASAFDRTELGELARAWEKLPPWPDVPDALARLRQNHLIAPCSNGSIALMVRLARYAGLPWDTVLGAEIARSYKPDPEVYRKSVSALGLRPAQVMMVAAHNDDLVAARAAGLATAFIPRPREHGEDQKSDLLPLQDWDYLAATLTDLADQLNAPAV